MRARTAVEGGSMRRELLLLALFASSLVTGSLIDGAAPGRLARGAGSSELLASLRRQLMANNYDYMSSDSEDFPARHEQRAPPGTPPPDAESCTPAPSLLPFVNDIYIPRAATEPPPTATVASHAAPVPPRPAADPPRAPDPTEDGRKAEKNDLLYYVDDKHISRRRGGGAPPEHTSDPPSDPPSDPSPEPEPKPTYTVIKVRTAGGSRRAGRGYRRFLQEEGEEGVSIINLGDEPFPEFRLPSARRQYMTDEAPDLEAAVPSEEGWD